jgi:diguanylate cyclase (GGDEF)-like protein
MDHAVLLAEGDDNLAGIIEREIHKIDSNIFVRKVAGLDAAESAVMKNEYELILLSLSDANITSDLQKLRRIVANGNQEKVLLLDKGMPRQYVELAFDHGAVDSVESPLAFPAGFRNRVKNSMDRNGYRLDSLTKLLGKGAFNEKVEIAYNFATARHERNIHDKKVDGDKTDLGLSLIFMDLDDFKPINDQYGHDAGDQVLKKIGGFLSRRNDAVKNGMGEPILRSTDVASRYGGDEFIIMLDGYNNREASSAAKRLAQAITSYDYGQNIPGCNEPLYIKLSYGISSYIAPVSREGFDEFRRSHDYKWLINSADKFMYTAKQERKAASAR